MLLNMFAFCSLFDVVAGRAAIAGYADVLVSFGVDMRPVIPNLGFTWSSWFDLLWHWEATPEGVPTLCCLYIPLVRPLCPVACAP